MKTDKYCVPHHKLPTQLWRLDYHDPSAPFERIAAQDILSLFPNTLTKLQLAAQNAVNIQRAFPASTLVDATMAAKIVVVKKRANSFSTGTASELLRTP